MCGLPDMSTLALGHTGKCLLPMLHIEHVDNSFCSVQLQNETPVREAPEQGNNQPHLVVFIHDEYNIGCIHHG